MRQANRGELERAARLGIQGRAVRDRGSKPGEAGDLLAARPGWLIAERERQQAQTMREEARQVAGELTAEQVQVRISRERDASYQAACYRAEQLLQQALGSSGA